ncbi:MAG: SapC family protein [Halothiobacillaceae bacterium]|nr:SapC family protein [Halothiobacillaceae bacterium]
MPKLQVISKEAHANKRWLRSTDHRFAENDIAVPLAASEVSQAMMAMPIAFVLSNDRYLPMAVMGLTPGKNLFVSVDGRWIGGYLPAAYKAHPFALANSEDGKQVLCIDEENVTISEISGEPFFGEDGNPAPAVTEILNFLSQVEGSRKLTEKACALLQEHGLFQPWAITLQGKDGQEAKKVEGLFRADEAALNKLPAETFAELRDAGALVLAYCQLLSMQHLPILGQLAEAHGKAAQRAQTQLPTQGKDLDLSFMSAGETFKFGG